ncbi:MAG: nucleoside monophosphate kinase [Candidatus Aminicenantes bacterium]|nr:nucleoside monophosphate kinase [Candidatus Aminicenantes bacterium]
MEDLENLKAAIQGKKILLFGPPGCGKGNRSRDLEALGLVHVSSGIVLRAKVCDEPDSELSRKASHLMERGELVPDDIIVPIIMEHMNGTECRTNGFVLDGFPRTKAQSDVLFSQAHIDFVLYLDVPRKFLLYGIVEGNRRICVDCATGYSDFDPPKKESVCDRCGGKVITRADDNIKIIENRLALYDEQTKSFLPDIASKANVEILPIIVSDEEVIDDKYLKHLKGQVYRVETDQGGRARMLNLEGMRNRLYNLLAEKFM